MQACTRYPHYTCFCDYFLLAASISFRSHYSSLLTSQFYRRNGIHRRPRRAMLLSVAVLYISACIHFVVSISCYANLYSLTLASLPTTSWGEDVQGRQSQILTATLTITVSTVSLVQYPADGSQLFTQIFVGDSIVWWRAYVLWARNYYVRLCCAVILAATLGALDIYILLRLVYLVIESNLLLYSPWICGDI